MAKLMMGKMNLPKMFRCNILDIRIMAKKKIMPYLSWAVYLKYA